MDKAETGGPALTRGPFSPGIAAVVLSAGMLIPYVARSEPPRPARPDTRPSGPDPDKTVPPPPPRPAARVPSPPGPTPPKKKARPPRKSAAEPARPSRPAPKDSDPDEDDTDPFKRPKGKEPRPLARLWYMRLIAGAGVPTRTGTLPKAGFTVSLGAGRVLYKRKNFRLSVELGLDFQSFISDHSVVLNPEMPPANQVVCKDKKGLTLWSLTAALAAGWTARNTSVEVAATAGGAYGEYGQLRETPPPAGEDLTCNRDDFTAWMPVVGGWARVGWAVSAKLELALHAGVLAPVPTQSERSKAERMDLKAANVLPVFVQIGAAFVHRF